MLDNDRRIKGSKILQAGFDPGNSNLASFFFKCRMLNSKNIFYNNEG